MYNEKGQRGEAIREKALELAISVVATYKNSAIYDGYGTNLVQTADLIADYIVNGKANPPTA
jgi:hypothetical protein